MEFGAGYRADAGVEASTPMEQACPLLFPCSDAAACVTGGTLMADAGCMTSGLTGAYPAATDAARFLAGRRQLSSVSCRDPLSAECRPDV